MKPLSAVAAAIVTFLEKQNQHREKSERGRQEGVGVEKLDSHVGSCVSKKEKNRLIVSRYKSY